jgi:two-component system, cell cycle sensor histidine kinase and response regulator CckA
MGTLILTYTAYLGQAAIAALAGGTALVYDRVYSRPYLRWLSAALLLEAVHGIGGLLALIVRYQLRDYADWSPAATVVSQLGGYGVAVALLGASSAFAMGQADDARRRSRLLIGIVVVLVSSLVSTVLPQLFSLPIQWRVFVRVGVLSFVVGVCGIIAAHRVWRVATSDPTRARGARWLAVAIGVYAIARFQYPVLTAPGVIAATVTAWGSLLPFLDILFVGAIMAATAVALVDDERLAVVEARESCQAAEGTARSRDAMMATMFASRDDLLVAVDRQLALTVWNTAFADCCAKVGVTPTIGAALRQVWPARIAGPIDPRLADIVGETLDGFDVEVQSADATRWFDTRSRAIREGGEVVGALVSARDITARKAMEGQLLVSHRLEAVGRLAGGVAHDFNNLLTVIVGATGLARLSLDPGHSADAHLVDVEQAAQRAHALTSQLLTFGRQRGTQPASLSIHDAICGVQPMLERLLPPSVALLLASDLPRWRFSADPGQFEQVLLNLVLNARDAMPSGGTIAISASAEHVDDVTARRRGVSVGEYVLLRVTDTGVGIDEGTRERLFEPFFTTKTVGQGTGLGLSICHGILRQHGGCIWSKNAPGGGSVFLTLWPRAAAAAAVAEPPLPTDRAPAPPRPTTPVAVLVVDDDASVRRVVTRILHGAGYVVHEAIDGAEGLRAARSHKETLQLIVSDVRMPQLDGRAMERALREDGVMTPVLFMSGFDASTVTSRGDMVSTLLHKPFSSDELLRRVRSVLATAA